MMSFYWIIFIHWWFWNVKKLRMVDFQKCMRLNNYMQVMPIRTVIFHRWIRDIHVHDSKGIRKNCIDFKNSAWLTRRVFVPYGICHRNLSHCVKTWLWISFTTNWPHVIVKSHSNGTKQRWRIIRHNRQSKYIVHVMNCMRLSHTNDVDVGSKKGITGTLHLESEM